MQDKSLEPALDTDDILEIEAAELELREDLLSGLFSCCCPCYGYPGD